MARLFDDASTQYLEYAGAALSGAPLTMACWFRSDDTGVDQHLITITDKDSNTNEISLALGRANPTSSVQFMAFDALASASADSTAAWSANTWHHACGVCAAVDDWRGYLDGGNKGTSTTSVTPLLLDTTAIGRRLRLSGGSRYFSGRIAEAAIWSAALDDAEVAALGKGICPLLIRPQSLEAYWPLWGNDSPELDRWKNRYDLTVTGATKADHTRMFYPTRAKGTTTAPAVAPSVPTYALAVTDLPGRSLPSFYARGVDYAAPLAWPVPGPPPTWDLAPMAPPPSGRAPVYWVQRGLMDDWLLVPVIRPPTWDLAPLALPPRGRQPVYWLQRGLMESWLPPLLWTGLLRITINGTDRTTSIRKLNTPLGVADELDEAPNFADCRCTGFTPAVGEEVIIARKGLNEREFAGHIVSVTQIAEGVRANVAYDVRVQDYTWDLNKRLVNATYTSQSATAIITDLIATYASGYTVVNVDAGLPTIDEIQFTDVPLPQALTRVVRRIGGYWYPDYTKDIHAFTADAVNVPDALTDATLSAFKDFRVERDVTQLRTRVFCEGGGSTAPIEIPVGTTILPVEDASWYAAAGGTVKSGTQRVTYTGTDAGGTGALVGAFVLPTNAPTVALKIGTGIDTGAHYWAVTFYDGSGETTAGPNSATLTMGTTVSAPGSAPTGTKKLSGNLSAGAYQWKYTFVDSAGGETTPSTASASVTMDSVADPSAGLTWDNQAGGTTDADFVANYKYTFYDATTGLETNVSPVSNDDDIASGNALARITKSSLQALPSGMSYRFYRKSYEPDSGNVNYRLQTPTSDDASYYYFNTHVKNMSADPIAPTANNATYRKADLTGIAVSGDANVTKRKVYRTTAGGSTFKLVTTINDNTTTTYTDNIADGSLGADAPSSNTAVYSQASLSAIPLGPTGTTGRRIYRTAAGGSQLKQLTEIANNTATTYTESTADASLGVNVPTSNTSALTDTSAAVNAGSTSIPVTALGPFLAGGGWATIGSQYIRYTGKSSTALTGVPASGTGALLATIKHGASILAAPILTGVPASGAGSVLYTIKKGDAVNVLAQKDDASAQATYGVIEHLIQDNRLSLASAGTRAQADLDLFKDPIVTIRYKTRDIKTKTGKTVTVSLGAPTNLSGTFKIQRVQIEEFELGPGLLPLRVVEASSIKFSFEDLVRRLEASAV